MKKLLSILMAFAVLISPYCNLLPEVSTQDVQDALDRINPESQLYKALKASLLNLRESMRLRAMRREEEMYGGRDLLAPRPEFFEQEGDELVEEYEEPRHVTPQRVAQKRIHQQSTGKAVFEQAKSFKNNKEAFTQKVFDDLYTRIKRGAIRLWVSVFLISCIGWFGCKTIADYIDDRHELDEAFRDIIMQKYTPLSDISDRKNLLAGLISYIQNYYDTLEFNELNAIKKLYVREQLLKYRKKAIAQEAKEALKLLKNQELLTAKDVKEILKSTYWFFERPSVETFMQSSLPNIDVLKKVRVVGAPSFV